MSQKHGCKKTNATFKGLESVKIPQPFGLSSVQIF